jgi:hypothetical protein
VDPDLFSLDLEILFRHEIVRCGVKQYLLAQNTGQITEARHTLLSNVLSKPPSSRALTRASSASLVDRALSKGVRILVTMASAASSVIWSIFPFSGSASSFLEQAERPM